MREEKINSLLVGEIRPINVKFPKKALDLICAAMLKKTPSLARKERGLITEAILYFAVRGLLDWEDEHREDGNRKKPSKPYSEG